ncbi:MAG TPA: hypothetical protein VGK32_23530 [Vicinamibacterales bacterium]|jgi:hypothetical protein
MALQTSRLAVDALAIVKDQPANTLQPPLPDGIHLRWSFDRTAGFPWYGYYLFRRSHNAADRQARHPALESLAIQPGATNVVTSDGEFSSDSSLAVVNYTAPGVPAARGLDLSGRTYLRFAPSELVSRVVVRVGLRTTIAPPSAIVLSAWAQDPSKGGIPIVTANSAGPANSVVEASVEADGIVAIQITTGDGVLVQLSFVPMSDGALVGWKEVPGISYPFTLPLSHPDYPASPGPVNLSAAEAQGLARVEYGLPTAWAGTRFQDLHTQLVTLVQGGPTGPSMASKSVSILTPPAQPAVPTYYPLDLVLVGALNPALAQIVGVYWIDQAKASGQDPMFATTVYDYMLVAAHQQSLGTTAADALRWLRLNGLSTVDSCVISNKSLLTPAPQLVPPTGSECYALPSGGLLPIDAGLSHRNHVGLRWDLKGPGQRAIDPRAVMYHVWRTDLGTADQPATPGTYTPLTAQSPVVIVAPDAPAQLPAPPPDWPPDPLLYFDLRLADGWYGYTVSGVDLFGRHSAASAPAPWRQWSPAPIPAPWYFKQPAAADMVVHPTAIQLLDRSLPPPPTGIQALALDDADPTLVKDAAYATWRATIVGAAWFQALTSDGQRTFTGLRVRWLWTHAHMRQAPDVQEFRIYFQSGQVDVLQGTVVAVTAATATESDLVTDIAGNRPADTFAGASIRVGLDAFKIESTQAGSPLRLRVTNIGPLRDVAPQSNKSCSIAIPEGHVEFVDYTDPTAWEERFAIVPYADSRGVAVQIPAADALGVLLDGVGAAVAGTRVSLDGLPDLSGLAGVGEQLVLDADTNRTNRTYLIVAVDDTNKQVEVDGSPNTAGALSAWRIVYPLRSYDVLLPLATDAEHSGISLATPLARPVAYGQVSVSAADQKSYARDARTTGRLANRNGNESPVGNKATVFRVRREPPPAPTLPPADSDVLLATRADYLAHSFFTFRWLPIANTQTDVFRALDESVFDADWEKPVAERLQLDPVQNSLHRALFPGASAEPRWDDVKCQAVADELNAITGMKAAGATRAAALAAYRALSNDAQRVLAGLPGNERAFSQITIRPLDSTDPAVSDRRGPDSPDGYTANPALRAFEDTLDGRSSSRYFYRAGSVDAAHNRSAQLSPSTPPVACPDVTAPLTPSITKAIGGDRHITLQWASNRERDLAEYRVYRSDTEHDARDIRLMTSVGIVSPVTGGPAAQPAEMIWTDTPVAGGKNFYYRVVAADTSGNASEASASLLARAYDDERPDPPQWGATTTVGNDVRLTFVLADPTHRPLVQRCDADAYLPAWNNLTSWLPAGTGEWTDSTRVPGRDYLYRVRVQDDRQRVNRLFVESRV